MSTRPDRFDADLATREARQKATSVHAKHVPPGLPVCPFALAEKRRIPVKRSNTLPSGIIGRLDYVGGEIPVQVTLVEGFGTEEMIRFTLAHEIGHYHLDGHFEVLFSDGRTSHVGGGEFASDVIHERQADAFASELLMPKADCLRLLKDIPSDDDGLVAILALAKSCQVSIHAAANRYIDLVERPTALVVSQDGKVLYCARSRELKQRQGRNAEYITKGGALPAHSFAARMTPAEVAASKRPAATDDRWDAWFGGGDRGEIQQEALGLGSYGKVITVLSANDWDAEGNDDDEADED